MGVRRPRSALSLTIFAVVSFLIIAGLVGLGAWQVERRAWKLRLIAQVQQRLSSPPVDAPGPATWAGMTPDRDAYRRVHVHGVFLHDRATLVQAVTALGAGFWVMTPLRTDRGFDVLVNRGFVVAPVRLPATGGPAGAVDVVGLLRLTEPKGGFLRSNDPATGHWFSRDVAAIAAARGLSHVAPYFIDADRTGPADALAKGAPVGGLTVVAFPNNHLVYEITWFGLALMAVGGVGFVARDEWRLRRTGAETGAGAGRS